MVKICSKITGVKKGNVFHLGLSVGKVGRVYYQPTPRAPLFSLVPSHLCFYAYKGELINSADLLFLLLMACWILSRYVRMSSVQWVLCVILHNNNVTVSFITLVSLYWYSSIIYWLSFLIPDWHSMWLYIVWAMYVLWHKLLMNRPSWDK